MKRMHINVGVENIGDSIKFYNALFGAEPVKAKTDYAKWMLEDPRINFAISSRTTKTGVDHLGIQVDAHEELDQLRERLKAAEMAMFDEGETVCCYARSEKSWAKDPSGVAWETFRTMENVQLFDGEQAIKESSNSPIQRPKSSCCPGAASDSTENIEASD